MTVLIFPNKERPRRPRLVTDEQRFEQWYEALDWPAQDCWYTLHELRAATGIPLARLPTILWRCGWWSRRQRPFALTVWHGPNGSDDSPESIDQISQRQE
jgi:hypothetical protein